MVSSLNFVLVYLLILGGHNLSTWALENINRQSETCGILNPIKNDVRTIVPWTVGIFNVGKMAEGGQPQFLTSGFIISPTLVVSVLGGPSGLSLQSQKVPLRYPSSTNLIVGAGIKTTDFSQHDQFAQYSRISFIEPFRDFDPSNIYNHRVVYHLKTPLNLTTPYVHNICLSLYFTRSGFSLRDSSTFGRDMIHSGFARNPTKNFHWTLTAWTSRHGHANLCQSHFRYYYQKDVFSLCVTRNLDQNSTNASYTRLLDHIEDNQNKLEDFDLCQSHGSVVSYAVGGRWFTTSTVTLIPSKKRGRCGPKSVYTMAPLNFSVLVKYLEWLYYAFKCPPNTFACGDSTCISMNKLCNGISDCFDDGDEHYNICGIEKTITHLIDFRISGTQHCPPVKISTSGVIKSCTDSTGQRVECETTGATFVGATVKVTCDEYHTPPKYSYQSLELQCSPNGNWSGLRPFHCERDCGTMGNDTDVFPWTATILRGDESICEATLIESSFLLTSADCLIGWLETERFRSNYQVSWQQFGGNLKVFSGSETRQRFEIKNVWLSPAQKHGRDQSTLALIQLMEALDVNGKNKPMAACYLQRPLGSSLVGQLGLYMVEMWNPQSSGTNLMQVTGEIASSETCSARSLDHNKDNEEEICIKLGVERPLPGAGLFVTVKIGSGTYVQVLKGIFSENKNGFGFFQNIDFHSDWLLDTLEFNS